MNSSTGTESGSKISLNELLAALPDKVVLVAGDAMLDRFLYGEIHRKSPESDAPVLSITRESLMPGGAANVAVNLRALGVTPLLLGIAGEDEAGRTLATLLAEKDIGSAGLVPCPGRPTTEKTRFIAAGGQLLRADNEVATAAPAAIEALLCEKAEALLPRAQAVILSDYNKGVLTQLVTAKIIEMANRQGVPVLVDPKKKDYGHYKGAFVITPNRKELSEVTGLAASSDEEIAAAAQKLMDMAGLSRLVVTRSEDGMSVFVKGEAPLHVRSEGAEVFDVSGAGDTAIACLAAMLAAGTDLGDAARLANKAGGLVVGKAGTAAITAKELQASLGGQALKPYIPVDRRREAPLLDAAAATLEVKDWQEQGLKVGFTNGCFDILHYGHVNYLNRARDKCDRLIVGLNHDASVRLLKGPERPLHDQNARAAVLGALGAVDMVILFGAVKAGEDNTPCDLIAQLRPDIYFKGGDYKAEDLPEAGLVNAYGGHVEIMPLYEGHSTTATIAKMKKTEAA